MRQSKTLEFYIKRVPKVRAFILVSLCIFTVIVVYNRNQDLVPTVSYTRCADDNFTSSRLVWPEQLPYGDRIREQMYYVPKGYRYEMTPFKRILVQNGIGKKWELLKPDQGEFVGCPVSQCRLTYNKSLGSDVDAVLFRHSYSRLSTEDHQIRFGFYLTPKAPFKSPSVSDADVFNWTANYRWDSDIPRPYGYFMKNNSPQPRDTVKNYALHKTKKVAWFVSNCNPDSNRTIYANELAKHISVDVYGGCGTLECPRTKEAECFQMLKNDYKFYLAFENSHCIYYVTENFFSNALRNDVLPIVMGPKRSDYELMAPHNSFIHVDDFESPNKLADYLHLLDRDFQLYNEYFRWKDSGTVVEDTRFYCRLCAMLHDTKRAPRHYEDINMWWRGRNTCKIL